MGSDSFPAVADHTARASYLLSLGRPAAKLAVYLPNSSFWLGDERADSAFRTLSRQLLEAQRDFDFVDEQSLAELLKPAGRTLRNQSGQGYEAVLLPSSAVLSKSAMDRLRAFAAAGGTVVFVGEPPALLSGRTYRDAVQAPPPTWAVGEPSGQVTPAVLAALPAPDFSLAAADPDVKYNHRHITDGEVYFVFNEGSEPYSGTVTLAGRGRVEEWDADSGAIRPLPAATQAGENTRLPLDLAPHATRILVIRR
jgi:hypothetical protein